MNKKYIVRLSDDERGVCQDIVKRLKGTSEKVNRAQVLLKADADGPRWPDAKIADLLRDSSFFSFGIRLTPHWSERNVRHRRRRASWMAWAKRN